MTKRLFLVSSFLLALAAFRKTPDPTPATFADPRLLAAVAAAAGVEPATLTRDAAARIRNLSATGRSIENLAGIEQCKNLRALDLSHNRLTELAPLSSLKKLVSLDLSYNQIEQLAPLGGLYLITDLDLSHNRITDITALVRCRDQGGLIPFSIIYLNHNPLGEKALNVDVPFLYSQGLGIAVDEEQARFDPPPFQRRPIPRPGHRPRRG